MQRDAVSLAVQNDHAKTIGADLVPGLQYLAAVGFDCCSRLVQASLAVEIDERAVRRWLRLPACKQAASHPVLVGKSREFHSRHRLFLDRFAQHGAVKL